MTGKELHKLRRQDLLQLLVTQSKENLALREELEKTNTDLTQSMDTTERLMVKLNDKDALIGRGTSEGEDR